MLIPSNTTHATDKRDYRMQLQDAITRCNHRTQTRDEITGCNHEVIEGKEGRKERPKQMFDLGPWVQLQENERKEKERK